MSSEVFPSDIITEILSRLPVKSLLQFRCVSKPWCSLIDSREFVKKHLNQSVITNTNLNLIIGCPMNRIFSISLDSVHPMEVVSLGDNAEHHDPPPFFRSLVKNCCNGLCLVVENSEVSQICIWNPFTRKYIELPDTPIDYPADILNFDVDKSYGFAYVSETDEYKVVRVVEFTLNSIHCSIWLRSEAKIFSSTSNEWRRIEDFPYQIICRRDWGAHLNGILHTVVETFSSEWSIMGFDVRSEEHAMVPKPEFGAYKEFHKSVDVLGGCLCLAKQNFINHVDVWVMKDYGVKDSWFKLLSIESYSPAFYPHSHIGWVQPLSYSKNDGEVILQGMSERLYCYDLRFENVRNVRVVLNHMGFSYYKVCFESLVSFPGFVSVDNVKGQSRFEEEG